MARVAVLIDRAPGDSDWKGGAAWALILALAESQHEVQVLTPIDPSELPAPHPRVNIARPASSFHVKTTLAWARALTLIQPEIVHTFAPRNFGSWPKLTAWPYLAAVKPALPRTARVATLFEPAEASRAGGDWITSHPRLSAFGDHASAHDKLDIIPLADLLPPVAAAEDNALRSTEEILIPAPIAEWADVPRTLGRLARFLAEDNSRHVRIVGGWGAGVNLTEKRRTWTFLADFGARVRLGPPRGLNEYVRDRAHARGVWTDCLAPDSFRAAVERSLASNAARSGQAVNSLSRIYSSATRW